jgi:predicted Zn-dependent protease
LTRYSGQKTEAADATAIDMLTKAGLREDALSRFFARTEGRTGATDAPASKPAGRGGMTLEWFATHPSSEVRRQRTARQETGSRPFTDAEWQAIRTMRAR